MIDFLEYLNKKHNTTNRKILDYIFYNSKIINISEVEINNLLDNKGSYLDNHMSLFFDSHNKSFTDYLDYIISKSQQLSFEFSNWDNLNDDTKTILINNIMTPNSSHVLHNKIKQEKQLLSNPPKGIFGLISKLKYLNHSGAWHSPIEIEKLSQLLFLKEINLYKVRISSFGPLFSLKSLKLNDVIIEDIDSLSNLSELNKLQLINCRLNNRIPIEKLKNLKFLVLSIFDFPIENLIENFSIKEIKIINTETFYKKVKIEVRSDSNDYITFKNNFKNNFFKSLILYKNLKSLHIEDNFIKFPVLINENLPSIKHLTINNCQLNLKDKIKYFINLETLTISPTNHEEINKYNTYINYTDHLLPSIPCNLIELNIDNTEIDFSEISHCKNLKSLIVRSECFYKTEEIQSLLILEKLSISTWFSGGNNNPSDVVQEKRKLFDKTFFLNKLKNLKYLKLADLNLNQINDIIELKNLEYLDLSSNNITNIDFLSELTNLKHLNLSHNNISSIESLSNLSNLESLNIQFNNIIDINPIKNNKLLEILNISNNKVQEIKVLNNLNKLTELDLSNNNISNLVSIMNLSLLKKLNISNNLIENINYLYKLNHTCPKRLKPEQK